MARYNSNITVPCLATADMSGFQHLAVDARSYGSVGGYVGLTSANAPALGILENKPADTGRSASVTVFGITKARVGGAVVPGQMVASANSGYLTAVTSGGYALGMAMSHTASGYLADVFINHGGFLTTSVVTA